MEDESTHGLRLDQLAGLLSLGLEEPDPAEVERHDEHMAGLLREQLSCVLPRSMLLFDALVMMMGRLGCDVRSLGDNNWITQWNPLDPATGRAWHRLQDRYNLAFFDGHVALTEIHKGIYLDSDYRVQPFKELDNFTKEMQSQIAPQGEP